SPTAHRLAEHVERAGHLAQVADLGFIRREHRVAILAVEAGELDVIVLVAIVHPDVARGRRTMVLAPGILLARLVDVQEPASIATRCNRLSRCGEDLERTSPGQWNLIQLGLRT